VGTGLTGNFSLFSTILSIPGDVWIWIFGYSAEDPKHQTDCCQGEFPAVFASSRDGRQHRGDRAGDDASGNESSHARFVFLLLGRCPKCLRAGKNPELIRNCGIRLPAFAWLRRGLAVARCARGGG